MKNLEEIEQAFPGELYAIFETVAANRAGSVKVFTDMDLAGTWLKSK